MFRSRKVVVEWGSFMAKYYAVDFVGTLVLRETGEWKNSKDLWSENGKDLKTSCTVFQKSQSKETAERDWYENW